MSIRKAVAASVTAMALAAGWGTAYAHQALDHDRAWLRPCVAEDGPGPCYWRADTRGNHEGRSFWIDRSGHVHYTPTPRAGR